MTEYEIRTLLLFSKYLIVTPQVYRTGSDEVISVTLFNIAKRTVIRALLKKGSERIVHKSATFHPEDSGLCIACVLWTDNYRLCSK